MIGYDLPVACKAATWRTRLERQVASQAPTDDDPPGEERGGEGVGVRIGVGMTMTPVGRSTAPVAGMALPKLSGVTAAADTRLAHTNKAATMELGARASMIIDEDRG